MFFLCATLHKAEKIMEEVNGCIGTSPSLPRVFGNMKLTADLVRAILGFKAVSLRLGVPLSNPPML